MLKTIVVVLTLGMLWSSANAQIVAQLNPNDPLLSNPYSTCRLSLGSDRNPAGLDNLPSYSIGQKISFFVSSTCDFFLYFFNIAADGSVNLVPKMGADPLQDYGMILPNEARSFPDPSTSFHIAGPSGRDRILLLGVKRPLSSAELSAFSSAMDAALSMNQSSLATINVLGLAANDWASAVTSYMVGDAPQLAQVSHSSTVVETVVRTVQPSTEVSINYPQAASSVSSVAIPVQTVTTVPVATVPVASNVAAAVVSVPVVSSPVVSSPVVNVVSIPMPLAPLPVAAMLPQNFIIRTEPGATILLNQIYSYPAYQAVTTLSLYPGRYEVTVSKPGFRSMSYPIFVYANGERANDVTFRLVRNP